MSKIIRRAVFPLLLLLGGIALIQRGASHHSVPVLAEQEEEVAIDVRNPFAPPRGFEADSPPPEMPPFGGPFFGPPSFAAPSIKQIVKRVTQTTKSVSEPALIRDVTVGGVTRLASGELKRTYSGDQGPSLCPT